jgi:hypothetical protein
MMGTPTQGIQTRRESQAWQKSRQSN